MGIIYKYTIQYCVQDVELMQQGLKDRTRVVRMNKTIGKNKLFVGGDPTLPPGWKVRVNSQGRENFR